ncbi:hypothetical protein BN1723_016576 [Verticillium longisporum]|uniref:Uncharacterized protein n=1 Tax=Verticillium longisporum TaxID=100787 RepID=A0A0G4MVG1_VERLO|nr:Short-chain dehydrogenase/reductase ATR7 like protein [Verticillium longisporum]CRK38291.1 hypothetical protein BN1708_016615 [Verticillium longisporum]CRK45623.1 hypothetical protein BN1723_016576 [Verticillium longisporum]
MTGKQIGLVTGGASGMGLEVAISLASDEWIVYILDLNASSGQAAVEANPQLQFIQVDVASWKSLSLAFDVVFKSHGRLDFVFANAGILQLENFYSKDTSLPPAEPRQHSIDINLKAVINTCHLARHYFLACEHPAPGPALVITASIASSYAQEFNPIYTATKAGVLGFMRSIATPYYREGIRTYAICPGTVRTNLLSSLVWDKFPEEYVTPLETIVYAVRTLIAGGDMKDTRGQIVPKGKDYGLAVECFVKDIFFRDQMEFINDGMRQICEAASLENQRDNLHLQQI